MHNLFIHLDIYIYILLLHIYLFIYLWFILLQQNKKSCKMLKNLGISPI